MAEAPRGRGAGINKPAWLVQKEREEAAASAATDTVKSENGDNNENNNGGEKPPAEDNGKYADATIPDNNEGGGGSHNVKEERDQFGRVNVGGRSSDGGGSGSGGDRGGGSSRDYDRGGRDYDYDRGGRDYHHRGGGGRRDYDDRRDYRGRDYDRRDERRGGRRSERRHRGSGGITFRSYEEEREWLDERRHKRRNRKSKFDVEPTPEQLAEDEARQALEQAHTMGRAGANVGATGANTGINSSGSNHYAGGTAALQPQQTRHARRIYVGNVPDISEEDVQNFFRDAIRNSIILDPSNPNVDSFRKQYVDHDPIISVYINRERRFAFLEFKTMEITTACLSLDGINVMGQGKVKVKRPNDYNAALAPIINADTAPKLDTAKLGIISPTVVDGPNKIFIGGLPYHLTESQVLELLGAFGTVKAFHLVKQDANAVTSKGYCFVEYADPNLTQVACMGLNGMDMGGGKQLSCRMAAQQFAQEQGAMEQGGGAFGAPVSAPPVQEKVVDGVDVDALLSAALGGGGAVAPAGGMPMMQQQPMMGGLMPGQQQMQMNPMAGMMMPQAQLQPQVLDPMAVANAAASALDAAFGGGGGTAAPAPFMHPGMPVQQQQQTLAAPAQGPISSSPTRILVLLNMVMDEDLATTEDHKMLEEEVREEVSKYGKLLSMKIPRPQVSVLFIFGGCPLLYIRNNCTHSLNCLSPFMSKPLNRMGIHPVPPRRFISSTPLSTMP